MREAGGKSHPVSGGAQASGPARRPRVGMRAEGPACECRPPAQGYGHGSHSPAGAGWRDSRGGPVQGGAAQ